MNTAGTQTNDLFRLVVAQRFRRRLDELASGSGRYVIDYLPESVSAHLFRSLIDFADREIQVEVAGDDGTKAHHTLRAVGAERFDILPLMVDSNPHDANVVTEGFASCLRDHYTSGAARPRLLVVFTQHGNETQKSAKEGRADARLMDLPQLMDELLEYQDIPRDQPGSPEPLREVAREYLGALPKNPVWESAFKRMERFLERATGRPPQEQGKALVELGCYLPDSRPDFGSRARLSMNIRRRRELVDILENPNVDTRQALADDFENVLDVLENLVKRGVPYLDELELERVPAPNAGKRSRNAFRCDALRVDGANYHRLLPSIEGPVLVVSAPARVEVVIPLEREHNRKEFGQVIGWNEKKQQAEPRTVPVAEGAFEIRFVLDPLADFNVFRLALTRGPRAVNAPIDHIYVVLYRSAASEVVFEETHRVRVDRQAWLFERKPTFLLHRSGSESPVEPVGSPEVLERENDEGDGEEKSALMRLALRETSLRPHVVELVSEETDTDPGEPQPLLELAPYRGTVTEKRLIRQRFRDKDYLESIEEIVESDTTWKLGLEGGVPIEIEAAQPRLSSGEGGWQHFYERCVTWLLRHPDAVRIEADGPTGLSAPLALTAVPELGALVEARRTVMAALLELASARLSRVRRSILEAPIPLALLPLRGCQREITGYLDAWMAACDAAMPLAGPRDARHEVLLQLDTVVIRGSEGIERVTVLPTHPWLLAALANFQGIMSRNFAGKKLTLERDEVTQMVPRTVCETWYEPGSNERLLLTDSAPFHWEFEPPRSNRQRATLDYMVRIIAQKLARYVQMHPHLRHARRTLRVGFVNAGDGKHVLDGVRQWLKWWQRDRIADLPLDQIPAIEVLFFRRGAGRGPMGTAFDEFFRRQISASEDDTIQQALIAKLRYRKCEDRLGPTDDDTFVHVCFVHGLVDTQQQQPRQGAIDDWWDGGFGDGLLATQLRRTIPPDVAHKHFKSIRGLWIASKESGLRGGLARLLMLTRSKQFNDVEPGRALFWESMLPNLNECRPIYDNSDWVVHLDRELSLEMFTAVPSEDRPSIIEYTDQEVPESPGYDTITVTKHRRAYDEQLGEILSLADLDIRTRTAEAQRAAHRLLEDINALSGSWALDFLLGSVADKRYSMRLKGNVGAALVYRWLQRIERFKDGALLDEQCGAVVPVIVSLEDLLRVTPAAGLRTSSGLVARYSNEVSTLLGGSHVSEDEEDRDKPVPDSWCDDLLVLYLTKSTAGQPSRIHGRVIEVKLGASANQGATRDKAIKQVRNTTGLLRQHLSGRGDRLDAMLRHKQLSLLLKSQLEQAVALGLVQPDVYEHLNVGVLSANLARGDYEVHYGFSDFGRKLWGDVFMLATGDTSRTTTIEYAEDVRLVMVPRALVEWLAFELDDAPTLTAAPKSTQPQLDATWDTTSSRGVVPRTRRPTDLPAPPNSTSATQLPLNVTVTPSWEDKPGELPVTTRSDADIEEISTPLSLADASRMPVRRAAAPPEVVERTVRDLERSLEGRRIKLKHPLSPTDTDLGPSLLRVYAVLDESESIKTVRAASEDLARSVGTTSPDVHVSNIPARRAVAFDLPIAGLGYAVGFSDVVGHPSFQAAQDELTLGFCAGIDMTGRPRWVDLAKMPHMLVAGTTGSGKTIFLRNIILTLMLASGSQRLQVRFSSSKPMDFRPFMDAPHAGGRPMATSPDEAVGLAEELVQEMERRIQILTRAGCDDILEYLAEGHPTLPFIVAVFDEYAEMVLTFADKVQRSVFESALGRLAQKARAAGIHLIVSMQRPDVGAIKGDIKANVPHRFALKVAQRQDSQVILDEPGAEALLGKGDMLYRDASGAIHRLQVPNLESSEVRKLVKGVSSGATITPQQPELRTCPKCGRAGEVDSTFGWRRMRTANGSVVRPQSYCRDCRKASR